VRSVRHMVRPKEYEGQVLLRPVQGLCLQGATEEETRLMNQTIRRLNITCALFLIMHTSLACSIFGPRSQTIEFASDPEGAEVIVDGALIGRTPIAYRLSRSDDVTILFRKRGYRTEQRSTDRQLSTLGILDIVGGVVILLPFFGLLSNAAWEHDPSSFSVILRSEQSLGEY
jgi:hypothetical protein